MISRRSPELHPVEGGGVFSYRPGQPLRVPLQLAAPVGPSEQVAERALRGEGDARPLDRAGVVAPSAFDTLIRYEHRGVCVAAATFSTVSTVSANKREAEAGRPDGRFQR